MTGFTLIRRDRYGDHHQTILGKRIGLDRALRLANDGRTDDMDYSVVVKNDEYIIGVFFPEIKDIGSAIADALISNKMLNQVGGMTC